MAARGVRREEHPSSGRVPEPPKGRERLKWLGPGFLWMVSAAGSGELLFSPRIGSLYGYRLVWALLAAVLFKWFINREIGRYAVCTGAPILEGFSRVIGGWALWLIAIPQVVVAAATIAGLASGAGTAAILLVPGSLTLWTIVLVLLAVGLVYWGQYSGVETAATVIALTLAVAAVVAAISVFNAPGALLAGFLPALPAEVDYGEVLPWIGFALSGAAGMMWYSYWLSAKGYGAAGACGEHVDPKEMRDADQLRLEGWLRELTFDNSVAVVGTLIIMLAFLVLGTELLRPEGLVPAESDMAGTLGRLLGDVWGRFGYWIMVGGVLIGFWSTVVSDQDGFARLFANGTRLLRTQARQEPGGEWEDEEFLQKVYLIVLLTLAPIALYLLLGKPVRLLQIAGAIEAAHIPIVAALTLYLNRRMLPDRLQPSSFVFWATVVAALFFVFFAGFYVYQVVTGRG